MSQGRISTDNSVQKGPSPAPGVGIIKIEKKKKKITLLLMYKQCQMSGRLTPWDKNQPVIQSLFTGQLAKEEVAYDIVFLQQKGIPGSRRAGLLINRRKLYNIVQLTLSAPQRRQWHPTLFLWDSTIRRQCCPSKNS